MLSNPCNIVTSVTNQTLSHCHKLPNKHPGDRVANETCDTCDNVTAFSPKGDRNGVSHQKRLHITQDERGEGAPMINDTHSPHVCDSGRTFVTEFVTDKVGSRSTIPALIRFLATAKNFRKQSFLRSECCEKRNKQGELLHSQKRDADTGSEGGSVKFRQRLRRLEQRLLPGRPQAPMLIFVEREDRDGFELLTGANTSERVTEERMNQLCSERPENSPIPAIIHMSES